MKTITLTEMIKDFLKENQLEPNDLASYLEYEHNFACYKDSRYDD